MRLALPISAMITASSTVVGMAFMTNPATFPLISRPFSVPSMRGVSSVSTTSARVGLVGACRVQATVDPDEIAAPNTERCNSKRGQERGVTLLRSGGMVLSSILATAAAPPTSSCAWNSWKRLPYMNVFIFFCVYCLSNSDVQRRNKFSGVIPKDKESRIKLVEDVKSRVAAKGKPSQTLSLLAVDLSLFVTASMPERAAVGVFAALATFAFRKIGRGYIRQCFALWVSPFMHACIVQPAKTLVGLVGLGENWDMGVSPGEDQMSAEEFRKSLSEASAKEASGDGEGEGDVTVNGEGEGI